MSEGVASTRCKYCKRTIALLPNHKGHKIPIELPSVMPGDAEYDKKRHVKHTKELCLKYQHG